MVKNGEMQEQSTTVGLSHDFMNICVLFKIQNSVQITPLCDGSGNTLTKQRDCTLCLRIA